MAEAHSLAAKISELEEEWQTARQSPTLPILSKLLEDVSGLISTFPDDPRSQMLGEVRNEIQALHNQLSLSIAQQQLLMTARGLLQYGNAADRRKALRQLEEALLKEPDDENVLNFLSEITTEKPTLRLYVIELLEHVPGIRSQELLYTLQRKELSYRPDIQEENITQQLETEILALYNKAFYKNVISLSNQLLEIDQTNKIAKTYQQKSEQWLRHTSTQSAGRSHEVTALLQRAISALRGEAFSDAISLSEKVKTLVDNEGEEWKQATTILKQAEAEMLIQQAVNDAKVALRDDDWGRALAIYKRLPTKEYGSRAGTLEELIELEKQIHKVVATLPSNQIGQEVETFKEVYIKFIDLLGKFEHGHRFKQLEEQLKKHSCLLSERLLREARFLLERSEKDTLQRRKELTKQALILLQFATTLPIISDDNDLTETRINTTIRLEGMEEAQNFQIQIKEALKRPCTEEVLYEIEKNYNNFVNSLSDSHDGEELAHAWLRDTEQLIDYIKQQTNKTSAPNIKEFYQRLEKRWDDEMRYWATRASGDFYLSHAYSHSRRAESVRLAQFYIDEQQGVEAFRLTTELIKDYPNDEQILSLHRQTSQIYRVQNYGLLGVTRREKWRLSIQLFLAFFLTLAVIVLTLFFLQ